MKISRFSFVNNAGFGPGGVKVVVPLLAAVPFAMWVAFPLTGCLI